MLLRDTRFGLNEQVRVVFAHYKNGQTAMRLMTVERCPEPWLDATSAVSFPMPAECVAIKNWSENEGIEAILQDGGVIEGEPVDFVRSGFVKVPVYRLTPAAIAAARAAA